MYMYTNNCNCRVESLNTQFICEQASKPISSPMGCTGKLIHNYAQLSSKMEDNLNNPKIVELFERGKIMPYYRNTKSLNDSTLVEIRNYYSDRYSSCQAKAGFPVKSFTGVFPTRVCGFCSHLK